MTAFTGIINGNFLAHVFNLTQGKQIQKTSFPNKYVQTILSSLFVCLLRLEKEGVRGGGGSDTLSYLSWTPHCIVLAILHACRSPFLSYPPSVPLIPCATHSLYPSFPVPLIPCTPHSLCHSFSLSASPSLHTLLLPQCYSTVYSSVSFSRDYHK